MTETTHTRSRRAALGGLLLQLIAFGGLLALGLRTQSQATYHLAWYLLGGVPLWFVTLLVFRQRELAALEALDLEELRRERQASGGGEAMFGGEGGGALTFHVAEARLRWMLRWLVPAFSLGAALYLGLMGALLWRNLATAQLAGGVELVGWRIGGEGWPVVQHIPIALVILAIVMLGTFLYSRYTSGMARAREWQLLRGCGSYMLGNALVIMVLMICLGVLQYTTTATWEQVLAYAIPGVMIVLALETVINFVLDIYRPRAAGTEPRAAFDSRLLGLFAEPGGIASSIADALNYQFGFQVSQTWFYQLLERAFVPLLATGGLVLWLLSGVVVVQPYEHVIVERFGRQLNPGGPGAPAPLGPGLHFKLPWPIDVARAYNTGQLHQFSVGFARQDATPDYEEALKQVQLWTDPTHFGLEHFNFLVCPSAAPAAPAATAPAEPLFTEARPAAGQANPVHLIRMEVAFQYRIDPDRLHLFTRAQVDPHATIRDMAWDEVTRLNASVTVDYLMSGALSEIGRTLRTRLAERVAPLGLEPIYVGITNVHPEITVAQAYREVIGAEQQKVATIREARITESQRLAAAAGEVDIGRALARAATRQVRAAALANETALALGTLDQDAVRELTAQLLTHRAALLEQMQAATRLEDARLRLAEIEEDFSLGLGQAYGAPATAQEAVKAAEAAHAAALAKVRPLLDEFQTAAGRRLPAQAVETLVENVRAQLAADWWDDELDRWVAGGRIGGQAAVQLAVAMARRWQDEMGTATELARAERERAAYHAAPEIYKARRLMEVLVEGLKDARKFFLAFDPQGRKVRVRFIAEDRPGDIVETGAGSRD